MAEEFPTEFDAYTGFLAQAGIFDSGFWLSILKGKDITDTDLMTDVLPRVNRVAPLITMVVGPVSSGGKLMSSCSWSTMQLMFN